MKQYKDKQKQCVVAIYICLHVKIEQIYFYCSITEIKMILRSQKLIHVMCNFGIIID